MATRHIAHIVDDLDGTVLEEGEARQITFAVDGRSYEIDLSKRNAEQFYAMLKQYSDAGRRTSSTEGNARRKKSSRHRSDVDLNAVRSWARQNGHQVSDRGRVSSAVLEAYTALS